MTEYKRKNSKKSKPKKKKSKVSPDRPLKPKQLDAVKYYIADPSRNKFNAYKKAGYKSKGKQGATNAYILFNKPNVKRAVEEEKEKLRKKVEDQSDVNVRWAVTWLRKVVEFDVRELFDMDGNLLNPRDLPEDVALTIAEIETEALPPFVLKMKQKLLGDDQQLRRFAATKKVKTIDRLAALRTMKEIMGWDGIGLDKPGDKEDKISDSLKTILGSIPKPPDMPEHASQATVHATQVTEEVVNG